MERYIREYYRIENDPRYNDCRIFLDHLLKLEIPPNSLIKNLYGKEQVEGIKKLLDKLFATVLTKRMNIRKHLDDVPHEIALTRKKLNYNTTFQKIQTSLLLNIDPEIEDLEIIYGEYAEKVRNSFSIFHKMKVKRKCGITATAHHNRVGALVNALGFNNNSGFKYSAIGALHDVIEDLLLIHRDEKGPFGLERIYDFMNTFIPSDLQEGVALLTNYYDLILSHIFYKLQKDEKVFSKDELLAELKNLSSNSNKYIKESAEKMHNFLEKYELGPAPFEYSKWLCYKSLFISDMAKYTLQVNDYRTFQIKAIDLSDNAHGSKALSTNGRIRNICKLSFWATEGFKLQTNWQPLNSFVMELFDDALYYAEAIIISDLLEETSSLDFLTSAVSKIKKLEGIFYTDQID